MIIGADTYFQDPASMLWGKGAPPDDALLSVTQMVGLLYLPNDVPTTLGETVTLDDGAKGYVLVTEPPPGQSGGMGGMDLAAHWAALPSTRRAAISSVAPPSRLSAGSLTRVVGADDFLTREVRVSVVGFGGEAGDIVTIRYHGFGEMLSIEPPENYIELPPEALSSGVQEPAMVSGLARNGDGNVEVTFSKPVFVQGEIVLYVLEPSTGGWELPLLSRKRHRYAHLQRCPRGQARVDCGREPDPLHWLWLGRADC